MSRVTGSFEAQSNSSEAYQAFVPLPLPPNPPLEMSYALVNQLGRANRSLGRLDALGTFLPDISLFLYFYVRKEALLSSQIEGTQSSFSDLLRYEAKEAPGVPLEDVAEVSSYVSALSQGLEELKSLPICGRLLKDVHAVLLAEGRGSTCTPGRYRRNPVWLGGPTPGKALFVPPPSHRVDDCMAALEQFINDRENQIPPLIKAALAHAQFETIHPFPDGNGRLGRMLITLLLCAEEVLMQPLLYLSLYFKTHRDQYYHKLQQVRVSGDWEGWLAFFLQGVAETADLAVETAQAINQCFERDRVRIREQSGRQASSILAVHDYFKRNPVGRARQVKAEAANLSLPTVYKALHELEEYGVLAVLQGEGRGKVYYYRDYLDLLEAGTSPLSLA